MTDAAPPDSALALRRQLTRLGQKLLRMQFQVESANRARRRAESLLDVLSGVYEAANLGLPLEARSEQFARSLVGMVRAGRVLLVDAATSTPLAALGFDTPPDLTLLAKLPWGSPYAFVSEEDDTLDAMTATMSHPRVLWVEEADMKLAVLLSSAPGGFRTPTVTPEDADLVRNALRVFGLLRAREVEAQYLRKARADAQEANNAKSRFLANMSHEIRTPMNGVLAVAEELLEWKLASNVRDRIQTIHDSGSALLTVLNDILDFSKVEAGRMELHLQPVELAPLLKDIEVLFRRRAEYRGLEFRREDGPIPRWLQLDPTRVRQILSNLIGNAVKFTDRGFVQFGVRFDPDSDSQGRLLMTVTDTGIGMTVETAERAFEPFVQARDAHNRRHGGTGLGLPICAELVRLMNGTLNFSSEVSAGSRFEVLLPCRIAAPPASSDESPEDRAPPSLRVLIAEDDRTNQMVARRLLERMGHSVELAGNRAEAIQAVTSETFDLVLMDVQMPECDGLEATRRLRADGCEIPIIALTANAMNVHREECLAAGMNGYVTKPVRREALRAEILRVVNAPRARPDVRV